MMCNFQAWRFQLLTTTPDNLKITAITDSNFCERGVGRRRNVSPLAGDRGEGPRKIPSPNPKSSN